MKNAEKIMSALMKEFSGHKVELSYNFNAKIYCVFVDDNYVGNFEDRFCEKDFDNPEIEIKIKARVNDIKDFLYECEGSGGVAVVMKEVERGLKKWEEGSQRNN